MCIRDRSEIHVYLERQLDGKWKVVNRTSENLQIKEYEPDPELTALLASYDTRAKEDAVTPIGELKGGDLAPENEIDCLPQAMVQDTALLDFINEVQMYYTGAQVSATALTSMTSQMRAGTIRKDVYKRQVERFAFLPQDIGSFSPFCSVFSPYFGVSPINEYDFCTISAVRPSRS